MCMAIMSPNLSQKGFLNPAFYDSGVLCIIVSLQMSSDNWSAYDTRSIDDLLDPRDTKSDMYTAWSRRVARGMVLCRVASIHTTGVHSCDHQFGIVWDRLGGKGHLL